MYIVNLIILSFTANLRIKSLNCLKHEINITVALLFCGSFFQYKSVFWINGVFNCNKLAVHFQLILGMIFLVLHNDLNCAVDKTIDTGHTTTTDCNINYRIILLMVLFITSQCRRFKTDLQRVMYLCHSSKSFFCELHTTVIKLHLSAAAQLENVSYYLR